MRAAAGFHASPWGKHPRIQLLTVADVLAGKAIDYPRTAGTNVTLKAAPRIVREETQPHLFDVASAPDDPPRAKKRRKGRNGKDDRRDLVVATGGRRDRRPLLVVLLGVYLFPGSPLGRSLLRVPQMLTK